MATYRKSLTASVRSVLIGVLAAGISSLNFAAPSLGQDTTHPAGDTPGGNNTDLTVTFEDSQGVQIKNLRLCAGGIDRVNGVDDAVHAATITLKLMHGDKVADPGEGVGLICYFDGFHGGSSTKVLPPLLRAPSANGLTDQVPLAVGADGTARLRVVSSNLITTANLEVKADTDGGGVLGKLPCTFGQSYGFRYKGIIASNPQGFSMAPRPNPPSPIGPGDEITVYNSGLDTDYGWEYSPSVLTTFKDVMTATLHLTFQRDLSIDASADYFIHNGQPMESIRSNADIVNPNLPDAANFVPVPEHRLSITIAPYKEVLSAGAVTSRLVPTAEVRYYVFFFW